MTLSQRIGMFIAGNEILRHVARGSYHYAWFRTKELVAYLASRYGAILMLIIAASLLISGVCALALSLGAALDLITVGSIWQLSKYIGVAFGIPVALYWFYKLLSQEEEAAHAVQELIKMQWRNSEDQWEHSCKGLAEAFSIFIKYPGKETDSASIHGDIMFCGPSPKDVSEEDIARLEKLGWYRIDRFNCFCKYF